MLILGSTSHLDAFSAYPNPTSLPGNALGRTTGTQEVGSSWSSRTKDESPQHSAPVVDRRPTICYLHNRFHILICALRRPNISIWICISLCSSDYIFIELIGSISRV